MIFFPPLLKSQRHFVLFACTAGGSAGKLNSDRTRGHTADVSFTSALILQYSLRTAQTACCQTLSHCISDFFSSLKQFCEHTSHQTI